MKIFPLLLKIEVLLSNKINDTTTDANELIEIRNHYQFVMDLLREVNLHINPIWYDRLNYYIHALNLDSVFNIAKANITGLIQARPALNSANERGATLRTFVHKGMFKDNMQNKTGYLMQHLLSTFNEDNIKNINAELNHMFYNGNMPKRLIEEFSSNNVIRNIK